MTSNYNLTIYNSFALLNELNQHLNIDHQPIINYSILQPITISINHPTITTITSHQPIDHPTIS